MGVVCRGELLLNVKAHAAGSPTLTFSKSLTIRSHYLRYLNGGHVCQGPFPESRGVALTRSEVSSRVAREGVSHNQDRAPPLLDTGLGPLTPTHILHNMIPEQI